MFKGFIMISIYGVIDASCVTMEHVSELNKSKIKSIERVNAFESFFFIPSHSTKHGLVTLRGSV